MSIKCIFVLFFPVKLSIFIFTNSLSLSALGDCEAGWRPYQDRCYYFSTEMSKTWQEAEAYCVSQSGHLASIPNQETTSFITATSDVWIGLNDLEFSDYLWSDGSALSHTNWGPGEPNDHAGRENCVELVTTQNGSSYWNDIFCDAHQDWVCMIAKGKTPTEPPVPPSAIPGNTY
uniref:C-type lectin domain-containing protein n=1 Tax=Astyanax mexicanus TaxID=7994 RepID=A0A8B9LWB6_ASTMX